MYLAIEGCRSGKDMANHIRDSLAQYNGQTLRIPVTSIDYSDGPQNAKITEENAEKYLPDTHVVLVQRLVDPFAHRPAHYLSDELIRSYLSGELSDENSARVYSSNRIRDFLKRGVGYEPEHSQHGFIKEEVFHPVWQALIEFAEEHNGMTLTEYDNDETLHYRLQGFVERLTSRKNYTEQLDELLIKARTLHDYGAKDITAVIPYLEGRSDRDKTYGEGNLSRMWAEQMHLSGISRVLTLRAHSERQKGFYEQAGIEFHEVFHSENVRGKYIDRLVNKLCNQLTGAQEILEKLVVIGPDKGSEPETIAFASDLTLALKSHPSLVPEIPENYLVPWIIFQKDRAGKSQHVQSISPWKSQGIDANAKLGKKITIIRDDIFDTGGTITALLKTTGLMAEKDYYRGGTGYCFIVVDAPVFSGGGINHVFELQKAQILYELYAARTIEPPTRAEDIGRTIGYVDIREPFTNAVRKVHEDLLKNQNR